MQTDLIPVMQEATEALIRHLLASEAFINYQQAQSHLHQDTEARALLDQPAQLQANLRKKQANGGVVQAEIEALRELQSQVQRNHTITAYAQTQQAAVNFLREINNEISQLLGINFASFANHTTC